MDMTEYDIKGRAVAHYFFDELEKIAYSRGLRSMYRAARSASEHADDVGKTFGRKKWVPFTQEHRSWWKARGEAADLARKAEARAAKEKAGLLKALERGKVGRETDEQWAARRSKIMQKLKQGPQKVGPVQRRVRAAQRAVGGQAPVENIEPQKKGIFSSPAVRMGATAVGLPALGAAGLYAGQQYLNSQQDPYGGY